MKIVLYSEYSKKNSLNRNTRTGLLLLLILLLFIANFAIFTPAKGVVLESTPIGTIYIDVPFVQASYALDSGTLGAITENFNFPPVYDSSGYAQSQGASGKCPEQIAVGTISPTGECLVYDNDPFFGGATTDIISDPYDLGEHSTYIATHLPSPLTVTFTSPKKYIGFWWSAGSYGNKATFLDSNGGVFAQLNADAIYNAAGSAYYGHPGVRNPEPAPSCNPGDRFDCTEPFVYVHAIAAAGIEFGGVQFSTTGNGFELDNLTTADDAPEPLARLISVTSVYSGVTLPESTCSFGSYFAGWYSDPNFNEFYYIGTPGETYFPTNSSSEIFADCQSSWLTVAYSFPETGFYCEFNGYWNDPVYSIPQNILDAQGIEDQCESSILKPGYQLTSWYSDVDGVVQNYNFGDLVDSEYLVLYPVWSELSSNLIAPDVVLVDPRASFVNFPEISLDGSSNILICVQESNSGGLINDSPVISFDVSAKDSAETTGAGSATISGDRTSTLLLRHTRQNVLDTFNSLGGLRAYLSSGNFTSTKYVRVRTVPVATSTTAVTSTTCADAASSASKTIEIRPLGLTNTIRKGTIQLK